MTREEAIARGMEVHETKHSMKRRSPWHDYSWRGIYMLTLVVEGRAPLLGVLKGNAEAPDGSPDRPKVECTALGSAILHEEVAKIHRYYPMVEVWRVCVMPDHIHMIVRVKEDMGEGKHLGMVVAGFKGGCSKVAMALGVRVPCASHKIETRTNALLPVTTRCIKAVKAPSTKAVTAPCTRVESAVATKGGRAG